LIWDPLVLCFWMRTSVGAYKDTSTTKSTIVRITINVVIK